MSPPTRCSTAICCAAGSCSRHCAAARRASSAAAADAAAAAPFFFAGDGVVGGASSAIGATAAAASRVAQARATAEQRGSLREQLGDRAKAATTHELLKRLAHFGVELELRLRQLVLARLEQRRAGAARVAQRLVHSRAQLKLASRKQTRRRTRKAASIDVRAEQQIGGNNKLHATQRAGRRGQRGGALRQEERLDEARQLRARAAGARQRYAAQTSTRRASADARAAPSHMVRSALASCRPSSESIGARATSSSSLVLSSVTSDSRGSTTRPSASHGSSTRRQATALSTMRTSD
jgi:hypothetical protein